jgi:hypothetical protein
MTRLKSFIAMSLIVSLTGLGLPLPAHAALLGADAAAATPADRAAISAALQRADVRMQLEAYGVSPAQVQERVAALSDAEAAELAGAVERLPAGGDGGGLIAAAVFVFLVLLVTDILGFTKIFPFTRSVR